MTFKPDYEEIIKRAFYSLPYADGIIFNIDTIGAKTKRRQIKKVKMLHFFNALNYGTARLSVRNNSARTANLCFSRLFGGGTIYSCGEDTLFITDMLKKGFEALLVSRDNCRSKTNGIHHGFRGFQRNIYTTRALCMRQFRIDYRLFSRFRCF